MFKEKSLASGFLYLKPKPPSGNHRSQADMSIKFIFDNKKDVPESLQSQAEEKDGKFEVDGTGFISKNKELLGKNSSLTTRIEELEADKTALESSRDEYKGKAKLPAGHKLVPNDVAELGEAAKEAGLIKDEMPTLKTAKADLQGKLDALKNKETVSEVAGALGLNNKFKLVAQDKNLKFEKTTQKENGKDVDVWNVVKADGTKEKVEDFLTSDAYFKEFAEDFTDGNKGFQYPDQKPDKDRKPQKVTMETEIAAQSATGIYGL